MGTCCKGCTHPSPHSHALKARMAQGNLWSLTRFQSPERTVPCSLLRAHHRACGTSLWLVFIVKQTLHSHPCLRKKQDRCDHALVQANTAELGHPSQHFKRQRKSENETRIWRGATRKPQNRMQNLRAEQIAQRYCRSSVPYTCVSKCSIEACFKERKMKNK